MVAACDIASKIILPFFTFWGVRSMMTLEADHLMRIYASRSMCLALYAMLELPRILHSRFSLDKPDLDAEARYAFAVLTVQAAFEIFSQAGAGKSKEALAALDRRNMILIAAFMALLYIHFENSDTFQHQVALAWTLAYSARALLDSCAMHVSDHWIMRILTRLSSVALMISMVSPGMALAATAPAVGYMEIVYGVCVAMFHPMVSTPVAENDVKELKLVLRPVRESYRLVFPERPALTGTFVDPALNGSQAPAIGHANQPLLQQSENAPKKMTMQELDAILSGLYEEPKTAPKLTAAGI